MTKRAEPFALERLTWLPPELTKQKVFLYIISGWSWQHIVLFAQFSSNQRDCHSPIHHLCIHSFILFFYCDGPNPTQQCDSITSCQASDILSTSIFHLLKTSASAHSVQTCDMYGRCIPVSLRRRHDQPHCRALTSLPQNKSWHHRRADTAPPCRHSAVLTHPQLPTPCWSCDICALGSCWFAYRAREDSDPPPPPASCLPEDPCTSPISLLPRLCSRRCWWKHK